MKNRAGRKGKVPFKKSTKTRAATLVLQHVD